MLGLIDHIQVAETVIEIIKRFSDCFNQLMHMKILSDGEVDFEHLTAQCSRGARIAVIVNLSDYGEETCRSVGGLWVFWQSYVKI